MRLGLASIPLLPLAVVSAFVVPTPTNSRTHLTQARSFLGGDLLGSMLGRATQGTAKAPDSWVDRAPSWDEMKERLKQKQTEEEQSLSDLRAKGRGPTSSKATLRLFDAPDDYEPRVLLYRDSAAWCPYCCRIWLQLEEKRIPYRIEKINMRCYGAKPASFMELSPSGLLPVAVIDGQVITESADIAGALEQFFPEYKPLLPPISSPESAAVPKLLRLERELFGGWLRWLTTPPPMDEPAKGRFLNMMGRVEAELVERGGPYFLGEELTIVDCFIAPFLERMAASLAYYKGFSLRRNPDYPAVEKWFAAIERRPTFLHIKSDWYTHVKDLPPQIGACYFNAEGQVLSGQIDGKDGVSWKLPLPAGGVEPIVLEDEDRAKREAAAQLIQNHEAVARFACRAVGSPGIPPVAAELADPNAKPNESFVPLVDSSLRAVALALLDGTTKAEGATPVPKEEDASSSIAPAEVTAALHYLRDRVGVPRDLSFEAARQLRAHLNWVTDQLQQAK